MNLRFFVIRAMDKFIFFLLNFPGISFKIKIFVTNSRKNHFFTKKVYIKIFIHFKLLYNNWKFLPCTQAPQGRMWYREPKPNRICSYPKFYEISM